MTGAGLRNGTHRFGSLANPTRKKPWKVMPTLRTVANANFAAVMREHARQTRTARGSAARAARALSANGTTEP